MSTLPKKVTLFVLLMTVALFSSCHIPINASTPFLYSNTNQHNSKYNFTAIINGDSKKSCDILSKSLLEKGSTYLERTVSQKDIRINFIRDIPILSPSFLKNSAVNNLGEYQIYIISINPLKNKSAHVLEDIFRQMRYNVPIMDLVLASVYKPNNYYKAKDAMYNLAYTTTYLNSFLMIPDNIDDLKEHVFDLCSSNIKITNDIENTEFNVPYTYIPIKQKCIII